MRYLNYLSMTFNVRTPQGRLVPYMPYSWQIDFHANSLLMKQERATNDFIMKGRGISFSYSVMIEAVNVGCTYHNTIMPVMAHRKQAAQDIVDVGRWLTDNAHIKIDYNRDKSSELEIYNKYGKSVIRPYPTGTPNAVDAVRGLRPVFAVVDEAGFVGNLKPLLTAIQGSIQTKESKVIVGGTPRGKVNHYWKMHTDELQGYRKYNLPGFDGFVTPENIANMKPLVWWYNIDKLRNDLINNPDDFAQEIMAAPYNDEETLIPLVEIDTSFTNDYDESIGKEFYYTMGIDVASIKDYATITVFKSNGKQHRQVLLRYFKKMLLDDFEKVCDSYITQYNPTESRIDCTGMGLHLAQNLTRKHGAIIKSVHFSNSIKYRGQSINIRKYMLHNLQYQFHRNSLDLIKNTLQMNHISSIDKGLNLKSKNGHNDIAICDALALMPLNFKFNPEYQETVATQLKPKDSELMDMFKGIKGSKKFTNMGGFKVARF